MTLSRLLTAGMPQLNATPVQMLISDANMPNMTGLELVGR